MTPTARELGSAEVAGLLLPPNVRERRAWGDAVVNALRANDLRVDATSACAVIAIIGQESGFAVDPVVPGLAALVASRLEGYKSKLGPLGDPVVRRLLAGRSPEDARTFEQRLATVRTERDVDLLFRDLLTHYQVDHPALFRAADAAGKLVEGDGLAELNPITTAGSMQVSVRFAEEWARARKGDSVDSASVRESLYTRAGGVYYGTARLLAYPAGYADAVFRFADYNAGYYASRNAAVQAQVSRLTGKALALDGDLLSYEKNGTPRDAETESLRAVNAFARKFAPELGEARVRIDLLTEKTLGFEDTATYAAIKRAAARTPPGVAPPEYAILPHVAISSPKFTGVRSTAWFAERVDRRYRTCLIASERKNDR